MILSSFHLETWCIGFSFLFNYLVDFLYFIFCFIWWDRVQNHVRRSALWFLKQALFFYTRGTLGTLYLSYDFILIVFNYRAYLSIRNTSAVFLWKTCNDNLQQQWPACCLFVYNRFSHLVNKCSLSCKCKLITSVQLIFR